MCLPPWLSENSIHYNKDWDPVWIMFAPPTLPMSENSIHYNKDWDGEVVVPGFICPGSENSIHYNKDWDHSISPLRSGASCQRTASITTRIETQQVTFNTKQERVREQHPLQQGLRLLCCKVVVPWLVVREQHPLQQGLRHLLGPPHGGAKIRQRTASITTRIETYLHPVFELLYC